MRKFKIKKEDRKAWLDALESNKYKQGENELKRGDTFCCLGVFADIKQKDISGNYLCDLSDTSEIPKCLLGNTQNSFAFKLAAMNDNGKSFKEIAKYIRKHTVGI